MWMRARVRADLDSAVGEPAQLFPVHRREVAGKRGGIARELRNTERTAVTGVLAAGEDRDRYTKALECRKRLEHARERIVEGDVQYTLVARHGVGRSRRAVPTGQQTRHLPFDRRRRQRQLVLPPVRDRVVAEDERTVGRYGVRSSGRCCVSRVGVSGRTVRYSP